VLAHAFTHPVPEVAELLDSLQQQTEQRLEQIEDATIAIEDQVAKIRDAAHAAAARKSGGGSVSSAETAHIVSEYQKLVAAQLAAAQEMAEPALEAWSAQYSGATEPAGEAVEILQPVLPAVGQAPDGARASAESRATSRSGSRSSAHSSRAGSRTPTNMDHRNGPAAATAAAISRVHRAIAACPDEEIMLNLQLELMGLNTDFDVRSPARIVPYSGCRGGGVDSGSGVVWCFVVSVIPAS
jgi:hypothetical protein